MEAPKRILIVDDEKDSRSPPASPFVRPATMSWSKRAHQGGRNRPSTRLRGKSPFDLMVTDLRMPLLSGVEMVEVLRERGIPLHVLTISSLCRKGILCTMDCSCGTNHLDKPFEPRELVESVGKILNGDRLK